MRDVFVPVCFFVILYYFDVDVDVNVDVNVIVNVDVNMNVVVDFFEECIQDSERREKK
jgi:hypothetical protein